jgi:hypothetical protein
MGENANAQLDFRQSAGLTSRQLAEGITVYTATAQGVTYQVEGVIVDTQAVRPRRVFRAYRVTGLWPDVRVPAASGGEHRTRAAAYAQAEMDLADVLADREREAPAPAAAPEPVPADALPELLAEHHEVLRRIVARAKYEALRRVLDVLDGWIDGQKENHEALGHAREPLGSECWTRFYPGDIREMVNDAARESGTREPWTGRR